MITAAEKVKAIRDAGYKVAVRHDRRLSLSNRFLPGLGAVYEAPAGSVVLGHGGRTTVTVFVETESQRIQIASGLAVCSDEDQFDKRKGFALAVQRAVAGAPELRAVIGALASEKEAAAS